jgi:hypothetical protein
MFYGLCTFFLDQLIIQHIYAHLIYIIFFRPIQILGPHYCRIIFNPYLINFGQNSLQMISMIYVYMETTTDYWRTTDITICQICPNSSNYL